MSTEKNPGRLLATAASPLIRWLPIGVATLLIVVAASGTGLTQQPDDLKTVLRELETIKKELADLKAILQRQGAGQPAAAPRAAAIGANVLVTGAPFKGRADAPITLVEFSDFQCPFCSRHVTQTIPALEKDYIQTGKLKYVYRNYPIESLHPHAFKAAEAAACADEQGRFWPLHDRLFVNQKTLAPAQLPEHAAAVGLDGSAFQQCLASGKFASKVRKDISDALAMSMTGTPAFVIGKTVPGSATVKVESFLHGAKPYAQFKAEIDRLLGR